VMDRNLYWRTDGQEPTFVDKSLEAWREAGRDRLSIHADPRFAHPGAGDWSLAGDSPAATIGFQPFVVRAGPRAAAE
jgi:hypothetical protein